MEGAHGSCGHSVSWADTDSLRIRDDLQMRFDAGAQRLADAGYGYDRPSDSRSPRSLVQGNIERLGDISYGLTVAALTPAGRSAEIATSTSNLGVDL